MNRFLAGVLFTVSIGLLGFQAADSEPTDKDFEPIEQWEYLEIVRQISGGGKLELYVIHNGKESKAFSNLDENRDVDNEFLRKNTGFASPATYYNHLGTQGWEHYWQDKSNGSSKLTIRNYFKRRIK